MRIAAFTLTFNRLELTKKTVANIYANSKPDYHLFIDQGSDDGTTEWLDENSDFYLILQKNIGITRGIDLAIKTLQEYNDIDLFIKLDNDIEIVTPDIMNRIKAFYEQNGMNYVVSPRDLTIDPNYHPHIFKKEVLGDFNFMHTTHTGGAFLVMPRKAFLDLLPLRRKEDMDIGGYFRKLGYKTGYLTDLGINHIGLNKSTSHERYIF